MSVAADKEKHKKEQILQKRSQNPVAFVPVRGVMSGAATYDLYKMKDSLHGVLSLVLPPLWGRACATQTVVMDDDIDDSFTYDDSLIHDFFPLLCEITSNAVYHNDLDDILVEVMNYFTDDLHMF